MAGLFWNARGLGDPEKNSFIKNAIVEFKLRFVGIQETRNLISLCPGWRTLVVITLFPGVLFLLLDSQVGYCVELIMISMML